MKTSPECLPCIIRLVLETARKAGNDPWLHTKVLLAAMDGLPKMDLDRTPAEVVGDTIKSSMNVLGNVEAFAEVKRKSTELVRAREPRLREWVERAPDPLHAAASLAVAGNAFDALLLGTLDPEKVLDAVESFAPAVDEYDAFAQRLQAAHKVVYFFDNAGEAVLDRILIERIARGREITCVARKAPFWNDVVEEDLIALGLDQLGAVTHPGTEVLGAPVNLVSTEFRKKLDAADLIIAKGAANFECLEESNLPAAFLFMVKCGRVGQHVQRKVGDGVLWMNRKKTGTRVFREGARAAAAAKK